MIRSSASPVKMLCLFVILYMIITFTSSAKLSSRSIGDVAINCGSIENSTALDGREWIEDAGPKGESTSSMVVDKLFHGDHVPYRNARISSTQFHYVIQVNPGQIFVRLHFYPSLYKGFEKSCDFFSVKANSFTLLKNFSASLAANALGVKYILKEYCMNVDEDEALTIKFSPSRSGKSGNTFAFINGIEIISMPTGLYYTRESDLGPFIVGQDNRFYIDNQTALEMVQRLNIGGRFISPIEDSGLYRRWSGDANYLMESEVHSINYDRRAIQYPSMPIYVAPNEIYRTSWSTNSNKLVNSIYSFTWKIPVDVGFGYLVRLHFCELEPRMTKRGDRNFSILINNQLAETNFDVIQLSGGNGVPVHRDYVVIKKGDKENGKDSLLIVLQSKTELMDPLLNGLEIMKLSNPDNNLASSDPQFSPQVLTYWNPKLRKLMSKNGFAIFLTIVIILVSIIVHNLRKFGEANFVMEANHGGEIYVASTSKEKLCRRFSFAEILLATRKFSDDFVIGKGGFGMVYKGVINNGSKLVAIKRLASYSKQGADEFWMEIETLSKLRHVHLVSLIGYCNESLEMILVYEYMHHGTLADHLCTLDSGNIDSPISWEQRLRICIGAARGLDYLHTGTVPGVIHRDVKDTNILLDENFVAKVSDFGIAKLENPNHLNSYVTTDVKGTFGYLDPEYFLSSKLSKKSDVYAFGAVLLVVLCGRPVVNIRLPEDQRGLVLWAVNLIKKGEVNKIIDTNMRGEMSSDSLNEFVRIATECLHTKSGERPSMAKVVASLEYALELEQQPNAPLITQDVESIGSHYASPDSVSESESEELNYSGSPSIDENTTLNAMEVEPKKSPNYKSPRVWTWKMFWKSSKTPGGSCYLFSISEVCAATSNFSSDHVVYDDDHSTVYEGFITHKNTKVSIQRFKLRRLFDADEVRLFCHQIHIPARLQHKNLASQIGYCYHDGQVIVLYDYMINGTAERLLYPSLDFHLTWREKLEICIGIGQGLTYLHQQQVLHRDLRPSNILFDEEWVPKLSSYGIPTVGPTSYLSDDTLDFCDIRFAYFPMHDFIMNNCTTTKSDVYSFGLIMLDILYGHTRRELEPYSHDTKRIECIRTSMLEKTLHKIIDPFLMPIVEKSLNEFLMIISSCLKHNPSERPSSFDVVKSLEVALQAQQTHSLKTLDINGGFYAT